MLKRSKYLDILDVRFLLDVLPLLREEVLRQDVENVGAKDAILPDLAVLAIREPHDGDVLKDWSGFK